MLRSASNLGPGLRLISWIFEIGERKTSLERWFTYCMKQSLNIAIESCMYTCAFLHAVTLATASWTRVHLLSRDLMFATCFSALADDDVEHAVVRARACALTKSNCLTEEWDVTSTLHRRNAVAYRWRLFRFMARRGTKARPQGQKKLHVEETQTPAHGHRILVNRPFSKEKNPRPHVCVCA